MEPLKGKLTSREYLALSIAGNLADCDSIRHQVSRYLQRWHAQAVIEGYCVRMLSTEEDIVDEDLRDFGILTITSGRLPVVWLNVTYYPGYFSQERREQFDKKFNLSLLCETETLD